MRNIIILITLISGLIFTSLVKNKTRLLEKELVYLDNEINNLSSNLSEASLDFQYLTTPKHISFLAKNFLDENFTYYKKSQINKSLKPNKDLIILKKSKKDLVILKKSKKDNTFNLLSKKKTFSKKIKFKKNIDNSQLLITQRIDDRQPQISKKKEISKKVKNWAGLQIIKGLFGIPIMPVK